MISFNRALELSKVTCLVIILLAFSNSLYAQMGHKRNGWWGGVETGVGYVKLSLSGVDETDSHYYLGFSGGYAVTTNFLLGIELSGWLYEASNLNDDTKGEGLSQVLAITRYYPSKENDLYLKFGGGYVSHWTNRTGTTTRKNGLGLALGAGYDIAAGKRYSITPSVTYNYGDEEDQKHHAVTFAVGITWD